MNDTAEAKLNLNRAKAGVTVPQAGSIAFGATMYGPKPVFAPDDGGGSGGGDGGQGGDGGANADVSAGDGGDQPAKGGDGQQLQRPDYLPEELWDEKAGFKADAYNDLVAFKANRDAELAQVPESADKYEVRLPATFKLPDDVKVPEGEMVLNTDDPRIQLLREVAHSQNWSQAQFEDVLAMGVNMDIGDNKRLQEAAAAEREKLGSRGADRVNAVTTFLDAKIGKEHAGALRGMMFTAKQVEAFEALQRLVRGDVRGNPNGGRDATPTELSDEEYQKLSPTERINYARSLRDRSR
ncbi:hypothetical protein [Brucella anthropi]|uniref:hypothetical protein n=1 Tax=Brucella anthropi TaxID=529 RepID=UPI0012672A95|nr:hypothetical protein [Brucella anthropi]